MNKCRKARDVMGAYVYGELPPQEMKAVRNHLDTCPSCLEEMRSQAVAVGQIPAESPTLSELDKQRVFWSVNGAVRQKPQTTSPLWKAIYGMGATGALASLLLLGVFIGTHRAEQGRPQPSPHPGNTQPVPNIPPVASTPISGEVNVAPVSPPTESVPTSAASADPGQEAVRASDPLSYRRSDHNKRWHRQKPRIRKEKARPLEHNSVEMGQSTTSEPEESGATTAPAPTGVDDVQQTPTTEGDTTLQ